jgi:hypothetical protein
MFLRQQLIMQTAAEDLKAQQEREAEEKKKIIAARIPKLDIESLSDGPWPPRAVLPLSACNRLHVHSSHVPISSKLPLFP